MTRLARAVEIRDTCAAALASAGLPAALVTLDARELPSGVADGAIVVVPPKLTYTTWNEIEETWMLHVVAGPWDNPLAAWDVLDPILDALNVPDLNLADAEPSSILYLPDEPPVPGYIVTFTPDPVS